MDDTISNNELDNIIYLESSSGVEEGEVLVSKSTTGPHTTNRLHTMNTQTNNRPLIITMIIIGIVIIVLLLNPQYRYTTNQQYSYQNGLTASVVPFGNTNAYNAVDNSPGHYTRTIYYTQPKTTSTTYTSYPTTTYTTYPTTTQTEYYPQQYGTNYDQNGCAPYANYSVTTGLPCR